MENVKRKNIPERMKAWIGDNEGQGYALKSLTYDGTDGDVWVAALENSEGKARIITCIVRKNGGWRNSCSALGRGSGILQTVWRGSSMCG